MFEIPKEWVGPILGGVMAFVIIMGERVLSWWIRVEQKKTADFIITKFKDYIALLESQKVLLEKRCNDLQEQVNKLKGPVTHD